MEKKETFGEILNRPIEVHLKPTQVDIEKILTEDAMKVIRNEYATKYLEAMGISATAKNIRLLLEQKPFSQCKIVAGAVAGTSRLIRGASECCGEDQDLPKPYGCRN